MFVVRSVHSRLAVTAIRMGMLACVIAGIPSYASAVVDPKDTEAVHALLTQVRQAQEAIDSAHFAAVDETDLYFPEQGLTHYVTNWEVWQKGKWRASDRNSTINVVETNEKKSLVSRAILNDHQTITTQGKTQGEGHIHDSIATMSERDKSEVGQYNSMDIRTQAYGDGRYLLTDFAIFKMPKFRWYIEQEKTAQGDLLFSLRSVPVEGGPLRSVWDIDPLHGYIVTRVVSYENGEKFHERVTQTVQSKSGTWIPSRTVEIRYLVKPAPDVLAQLKMPNAHTPQIHSTIAFHNVELNPSLSDDTFGPPFLQMPNGSLLTVFQPGGSQQVLVVMDNMPLPEESAREIARQMNAIKSLSAIDAAPTTSPTANSSLGGPSKDPAGVGPKETRNNSNKNTVAWAIAAGMALVSGTLVLLWRSRHKGGSTSQQNS